MLVTLMLTLFSILLQGIISTEYVFSMFTTTMILVLVFCHVVDQSITVEVLEALHIFKYQPDLCVQKNLLALNDLFPSRVSHDSV